MSAASTATLKFACGGGGSDRHALLLSTRQSAGTMARASTQPKCRERALDTFAIPWGYLAGLIGAALATAMIATAIATRRLRALPLGAILREQ